MAGYIKKNSRIVVMVDAQGEDEEEDVAVAEEPAAVPVPSSRTKGKEVKKKIA